MKEKHGPLAWMSNDKNQKAEPTGSEQADAPGAVRLRHHSGNLLRHPAMTAKAERLQRQIAKDLNNFVAEMCTLPSEASRQLEDSRDTVATSEDSPSPAECLDLLQAFNGITDLRQRQRCLEFVRAAKKEDQEP